MTTNELLIISAGKTGWYFISTAPDFNNAHTKIWASKTQEQWKTAVGAMNDFYFKKQEVENIFPGIFRT